MRVLIKGAGDLATGIAYRLVKCGFTVLMTETAIPTTVRRFVSFSRAVYEKEAAVEELTAVLAADITEAEEILRAGRIPIVIDERAEIISEYKPEILIDAIIAKRNMGTRIDQAPLVIGIGPGFTAGEDCHAVIETKRGHYLGKVITKGSAIPNTGVPGMICGFSTERLIKAAADGEFHPLHEIGDVVEQGEEVAESGGVVVKALMSGRIRGMLQAGVMVHTGMKVGDIDARSELEYCYTISDKARAIGGGVLEAICSYCAEREKKKSIGMILLAAGRSSRFGSNKLLSTLDGRKVFAYSLENIQEVNRLLEQSGEKKLSPVIVVTGYEEIKVAAEKMGFTAVINSEPEKGISLSVGLGMQELTRYDTADKRNTAAVIFGVCDQPLLKPETVIKLVKEYRDRPEGMVSVTFGERRGNPVLFDRQYYDELKELSGDVGGRQVAKRHSEEVRYVEAGSETELCDIDACNELERLEGLLSER